MRQRQKIQELLRAGSVIRAHKIDNHIWRTPAPSSRQSSTSRDRLGLARPSDSMGADRASKAFQDNFADILK